MGLDGRGRERVAAGKEGWVKGREREGRREEGVMWRKESGREIKRSMEEERDRGEVFIFFIIQIICRKRDRRTVRTGIKKGKERKGKVQRGRNGNA